LETDEYQSIRKLVSDAMDRTGLVEGATPKKSGKFVVRLPKSLHAALELEASREGVSLNQLVVTKLAINISEGLAPGVRAAKAQVVKLAINISEGLAPNAGGASP
jgi:hypothetical protein